MCTRICIFVITNMQCLDYCINEQMMTLTSTIDFLSICVSRPADLRFDTLNKSRRGIKVAVTLRTPN